VTAAAPSRGDRHTDLWVGKPGRGSLARLLRLPPTAAVALSPDLTGCLASPIDDDRVGLWTAAADVREIGRRTERPWGLAMTDQRLGVESKGPLGLRFRPLALGITGVPGPKGKTDDDPAMVGFD
jgi:hypothetical protein